MIGVLGGIILIVICSLLNNGVGVAGYFGGGREVTWLVDLVIFVGMVMSAGLAINKKWFGVLIDRDCRMSLSRLQLVLWTTVIVSALMTMGLTNIRAAGKPPPPPAGQTVKPDGPLDINIPPQIWALLGLGAFTAVSAPVLKDRRRAPTDDPSLKAFDDGKAVALVAREQRLRVLPFFDGAVLVKSTPDEARWSDLIIGDYQGSPYVDVSKLQQLAFTALIVVIYAGALWSEFANGGVPPLPAPPAGMVYALHSFPDVSWGLLALLGISHATYLADKQFGQT